MGDQTFREFYDDMLDIIDDLADKFKRIIFETKHGTLTVTFDAKEEEKKKD